MRNDPKESSQQDQHYDRDNNYTERDALTGRLERAIWIGHRHSIRPRQIKVRSGAGQEFLRRLGHLGGVRQVPGGGGETLGLGGGRRARLHTATTTTPAAAPMPST